MEDSAKKFCSILFDILEQKGIKDVVCSPGSRNVPLLVAASSRPEMNKHFVVDERSAAFIANGISLVGKKPVVLICTSGTALLNYSPAIAEAYYQSLPLIVISADRPLQWIDQDDSQTIRQDGALSNFVKNSYSIPSSDEDNEELQWYVNRLVNDAIITATTGRKGPVHINVHLSEPLDKRTEKQNMPQRLIETLEADSVGNKEAIKELANKISDSKVLLVAGFIQPDSKLQKAISEFSRFPNIAVMAETISNLHLKPEDYSIDSVLTSYDNEVLDSMAPDLVITVGGALVSRKLKEYIRRNSKKCRHWSVGYNHTTTDPFMSLTLRIETEPNRFFRNLNNALRKCSFNKNVSNFQEDWHIKRVKALENKSKFIHQCIWSELKAFDILLKNLPSNYNLFLSNGTSIRYAQIISYDLPHASYCNRGVSGIDGSVSTALGGALVYKGPTLLITGDLSMAYDIGALAFKDIPDRFKLIVIDNQGGGIFRFIPSTSSLPEREKYLCQSPILPLINLAAGYGWNYYECEDEQSMLKTFKAFLKDTKKSIMKVKCDGFTSAEILKQYMNLKTSDNQK